MSDNQWTDEQAKQHFWIISLTRLLGAIMVTVGMLIIAGVIDWPIFIGYGLVAFGVIDSIAMPWLLAQKWKSPDQ